MTKRILVIALLLSVMLPAVALIYAEEIFGVQIYPGAKLDEETTKFLKDGLKVNGAAYRTSDSVAKVAAFYKTQKILSTVSEEKEGAMFMKGSYEVTVTIQNPWQNMKTGQKMTDTLISIVEAKSK